MQNQSRPLRADAARNRSKIIATARAEIAAHGAGVGMDEIAQAAARHLGLDPHGDTTAETRIGAALAALITLGRAAGDIREDLTVDDVFLLLTTLPIDRPAETRRRWIDLVLPGITTAAALQRGVTGTSDNH